MEERKQSESAEGGDPESNFVTQALITAVQY